jgi:beta-phosphoglucomutase-like phosphatase (HAD superfamily)
LTSEPAGPADPGERTSALDPVEPAAPGVDPGEAARPGDAAWNARARLGSVEGVVLDLDGVLVDSEIWWDEVRMTYAARMGRLWTEADRAAIMGSNTRQWASRMRKRLNLDVSDVEIERAVVDGMLDRYARLGPPEIEGAVEAVRELSGSFPLAVASSAPPRLIEAALDGLGVRNLFRAVASSDEVMAGKPSPDVYLLAAHRLVLRPEACLAVEDSLAGVRAARAAGMFVVLVPNASIPPAPGAEEAADLCLSRLTELPDLLRRHVPGGGH